MFALNMYSVQYTEVKKGCRHQQSPVFNTLTQ